MFEKVGFIGLGLIGGSIAKAIRKKELANSIIAYDHDSKALTQAFNEKVINEKVNNINEKFTDCDLIFLCCPVEINMHLIEKLATLVSNDCIITDVGSTKSTIIDFVRNSKLPIQFIGGHPMAGSDKSGYSASKTHLLENAYYILSPVNAMDENIKKLYNLIKIIGALPIIMDPYEHDFVTAAISHTPHLIASALVNVVKSLDTKDKLMHTLAAGGFKDITRIASSSPDMWKQICITNQKNIEEVLISYKKYIDYIITILKDNNEEALYSIFKNAKDYRDSFQDKTSPLMNYYALTVDVEDKPGIIAEIATILSREDINIKNIGIINNREYMNGVLEIIFEDEASREKSMLILNKMNYSVYKR